MPQSESGSAAEPILLFGVIYDLRVEKAVACLILSEDFIIFLDPWALIDTRPKAITPLALFKSLTMGHYCDPIAKFVAKTFLD